MPAHSSSKATSIGKILLEEIAYDELEILEFREDMEEIPGLDFDDLIFVLERATSIHTVILTDDALSCLHPDKRSNLVQTIARLPNLQWVTIENTPILIWDLTMLLMKAVCLRQLNLNDLVLQGIFSHFIAFETSLMQHSDLEEFALCDDCICANEGIDLSTIRQFNKTKPKPTESKPLPVDPAQNQPSACVA
mmetsp:Transcript_35097/g.84925  ORF Transcript_35097/g.84925 Transcript_35097/m.84925 type:complete len:193 (+) Transcript_35097:161-739(+)|eukprot:CAMPEP_0113467870 /NCGR_PEP_ID=MMETSP0014_2-20120614/15045_1 /TAXON_ID=2857 /ORGANISM="Nitzschia sp." /LENGTH=192 /DNA_ID=CAMNT_0000360207 /DNA_START=79 /DNA_END=657 /DNA_ORIENTATION=- /assembly_acc=CAM_ASM_000159